MAVDLISMIAAGILTACIMFAAGHFFRKARGQRLPKWMMPSAVGATMIVFSIWNEYTWFSRLEAVLPESVVVLNTATSSAPWRPWTYAIPMTERFMAIDRSALVRSDAAPDLVRAEILLVQRWQPTRVVPVAFDCAAGARADLFGGAELAADGTLNGASWQPVGLEDETLQAVCNGG
ncbi:hypothetical protein EOM89_00035 [Candidatus Falkowbacteria bacterium]|nr:hypothetical protein [Candidatus Falkowbacteria bacterium]